MSELVHVPEHMTKDAIVALFTDLLTRVELGDSFEGWVEWLLPEPGAPADVVADVRARYRVGNRDGQGGMRFVGELRPREDSPEP